MLTIVVPATESYDERTEQFIETKEQKLTLEYSLVSVSKWESKWNKPFLSKEQKTDEETRDFIRCMTITQNVDPMVYYALTESNYNEIAEYINAPMTATWFAEDKKRPNREIVTAEIIYYWMIALQIPWEAQKWHLNRLMTLIRVCNEKNKPPKKMGKRSIMSKNQALNAARRQHLGSMG